MTHIDCVFCKIISGSIPSPRVFESREFIVIRDIQPQAKAHFLVIPKKHIKSLAEVNMTAESTLLSGLLATALEVAKQEGLVEKGFRTVLNTREWGGQSVHHLHLHVLGGQALGGSFA